MILIPLIRRFSFAFIAGAFLVSCGSDLPSPVTTTDTTLAPNEEPTEVDPPPTEMTEEEKVVLFFELQSESRESAMKAACLEDFETQAKAGVVMLRAIMSLQWKPHLAALKMSENQLTAFASNNPAFIRDQLRLSDKRHELTMRKLLNSPCFSQISNLPLGDNRAADEEITQIFLTHGSRPGPFAGVLADILPWETNLESGLELAANSNKPVLLFFDAVWCAPCKVLKQLFQGDALVDEIGEKYVRILIDVSDGSDDVDAIQDRFHARSLPSLLVLDPSGVEIARFSGTHPTETSLIGFLNSTEK